jgi:hypothetical protein
VRNLNGEAAFVVQSVHHAETERHPSSSPCSQARSGDHPTRATRFCSSSQASSTGISVDCTKVRASSIASSSWAIWSCSSPRAPAYLPIVIIIGCWADYIHQRDIHLRSLLLIGIVFPAHGVSSEQHRARIIGIVIWSSASSSAPTTYLRIITTATMQGERHPFSPSRRDHRRRRRHPVIGHLRHQQIVGVLVLIIIVSTYLHTYASSAAVERISSCLLW